MKKVLLLLAGVALLAAVSTSCNKGCTCKQKLAGVVINSWEQPVADGAKCSDYSEPDALITCK
jgi:hypothetical protein